MAFCRIAAVSSLLEGCRGRMRAHWFGNRWYRAQRDRVGWRDGSGMRRARDTLLATIGVALSVGALPGAALGSSAPVIESTSVSQITETSLRLEARVNPEGLVTTYQFWLECQIASSTKSFCEPGSVGTRLSSGLIPGGLEAGQSVSTELTGLRAGYTYVYGVVASNSAGKAESRDNIAQPAPPGACVKCANETSPYIAEVSQWSIEANNAEAARAGKEYEEQRARERQAAEEAKAKERAHWEAVEREAEQRRAQEEAAARASCVVPSLKGDSLRRARQTLLRAHCALGRVSRPRGRRPGPVAVAGQHPSPGTRLPRGAPVAVTVGAARHRGSATLRRPDGYR
jgi:hypothetical protein